MSSEGKLSKPWSQSECHFPFFHFHHAIITDDGVAEPDAEAASVNIEKRIKFHHRTKKPFFHNLMN